MIFRTYQPGDEEGLARVFRYAFAENGMNLHRDAEIWNWIYVKNPSFDPELIMLAEENGEIIAKICTTIETIIFGGEQYRVALIHELGTLPWHQGRGIMKKLFQQALNTYMARDVDLILLHSDPNAYPVAFPFYLRRGFKPIFLRDNLITLSALNSLLLYSNKYLPFLGKFLDIYRRRKWTNTSKNNSYFIRDITNTRWEEIFREKCNHYYRTHNHYIPLTPARWHWLQHTRPTSSRSAGVVGIFSTNSPTSKDDLVAGARLAARFMHHIKRPNNSLFILPGAVWDLFTIFIKEDRHILKKLLLKAILLLAAKFKVNMITGVFPHNSPETILCKKLGFHQVQRGYCLVKPYQKDVNFTKITQYPWYIPLDPTKGEP